MEAKKKHDELEMKKLVEQRKREKEEEKLARQRVKDQIEQDKLARKSKFSGQSIITSPVQPQQEVVQSKLSSSASYSEVTLQIRLTNGSLLTQKFGAKEPLSAVRLYVEMNRKDGDGPFTLMTSHPKKVFGPDDYELPLESLGNVFFFDPCQLYNVFQFKQTIIFFMHSHKFVLLKIDYSS